MGRAVKSEGDRRLFRHRANRSGHFPIPPCEAWHAVRRRRRLAVAHKVFGHSAASAPSAIRRLCSACSRYRSCQSVGPLEREICTAVTLNSGQLVAQSEKSVVTTLTCVEG